ncbi:hypothetical protein [Bdellovibrio sp. HCB337]|uniref:hypothetical protein n=1 Tax=Bdellovibrio sp. HCB337 TaxID=3394358 RepID=UPI0039A5CC93
MKISYILGALILTAIAASSATANTENTPENPEITVNVETPVSPRENYKYIASLSYSAADFPIPGKFGVTGGLVTSPQQTWELEYMRGTFSVPGGFRDLGSITDSRLSLIGRTYFGGSFHVSYGLSYFNFNAQVGDQLMNTATGGVYPAMNAADVQGLGANIGVGNTWVFRKDITVGVDWLAWAQPLYTLKRSSDYLNYETDEQSRRSVEDTLKIMSYVPRFAMVNVHVGMLF